MGVPAFFRWLSKKYPAIVTEAHKESGKEYKFDNLYLDMNGIIHPCSHPEHKAAPETEEEMFQAIFEYIENIMTIVRPRKVLYMAVDGVAPRAKMNQQRSRRFRAAKESQGNREEIERIKENIRENGGVVEDNPNKAHFDSNVITPGTQFMLNLSEALRDWIQVKLALEYPDEEEIWPKDLQVILSDASVPGEGEHKIMEYIRKQKASPNYNPNISHLLYGADADLIMLGLATHEMDFTILREEFRPNQPKPCEICSQYGHTMQECQGTGKDKDQVDQPPVMSLDPEFIFIRLCVLREYIKRDMQFGLELERFIDDFVFLCFFVGNDFLPHLPSLEIREGAIDRLVEIYNKTLFKFKGDDVYLTEDGYVNLERVQVILTELGKLEDDIFKNRHSGYLKFKQRRKRQKQEQSKIRSDREFLNSPWLKPEALGQGSGRMDNARKEAANLRMSANMSAASKLKAMLRDPEGNQDQKGSKRPVSPSTDKTIPLPKKGTDYNVMANKGFEDSDSEPEDAVQLWEDGWKERYYYHKFDCVNSREMSSQVAYEYVMGLCWVLRYYYQGCCDWKWFYPYHYAPFASDFSGLGGMKIKFDEDSQPFHPLEQLMSVFPAASSTNLPPSWRQLMVLPDSPIIDFYPCDFQIDLNGKRAAWMGVALLPFIDEDRLFDALSSVYPKLTEDEKMRNKRGTHLLFMSRRDCDATEVLDKVIAAGESRNISRAPFNDLAGTIKFSPAFSNAYNKVFAVEFFDPVFPKGFKFPAVRLAGAVDPPVVIKQGDHDPERYGRNFGRGESNQGNRQGNNNNSNYHSRPQVGLTQDRPVMSMDPAGRRMLWDTLKNVGNQAEPGRDNRRSDPGPGMGRPYNPHQASRQPYGPNAGGFQQRQNTFDDRRQPNNYISDGRQNDFNQQRSGGNYNPSAGSAYSRPTNSFNQPSNRGHNSNHRQNQADSYQRQYQRR